MRFSYVWLFNYQSINGKQLLDLKVLRAITFRTCSNLFSHYKCFVDTWAKVVLSCSCKAFNTFCTDGTTAFLTSALTALSSFPDRVVVSVCDRVLCSCSCLFLSPECFSRKAFSSRWAKLLVKETWFNANPLGIVFEKIIWLLLIFQN